MGLYFRFRLLTGQRGGETRQMRWTEVDLETAWWSIPASMAKNGLAHRVPLSPPALAILHQLQAISGDGEWVFPSPHLASAPRSHNAKPQKRLRAVSGVTFWPHDLRRTAASHMASLGIPRFVIGKVLNHVEPGVTKVYDRYSYDREKRQALDAWGKQVMALVTGARGKVVPLRQKG
jgi:integrase